MIVKLSVDCDFFKFNNIIFNVGFCTDLEQECYDWLWSKDSYLKLKLSSDVSIIENKQWNKIAIITWVP